MTAHLPIPACLAHRPVHAGVAVPWFVITLPDGTVDFAACEGLRVNRAMLDGTCGVCGRTIAPGSRLVFFVGGDQLDDLTFDALPMHPECAAYSARACPMVSGRLATYRAHDTRAHTTHQACGRPGCDCGGFVVTDAGERGQPSPVWFAVWCTGYDRVASSERVVDAIRRGVAVPGERILARVARPLRVRPVARCPVGAR